MTAQKAQSPGGAGQCANQTSDARILQQNVPDRKALETARARFALLGYVLTVSRRADDGRHSWAVSKWNHSRHLSHWSDVVALLTQMEEA